MAQSENIFNLSKLLLHVFFSTQTCFNDFLVAFYSPVQYLKVQEVVEDFVSY